MRPQLNSGTLGGLRRGDHLPKRHPTQQRLLHLLTQLDEIGADVEHYIVSDQANRDHDAVPSLAKRPRQLVREFQHALSVALEMLRDASRGYGSRTKNNLDPRMPYLARPEVDGHEAMSFVLRVFVLTACAELERFLRELARWHLTPLQLGRIRKDSRRPPNLARLDSKARAQLLELVRPTSGRPTAWPNRLKLVFGVPIPRHLASPLGILIRWRHEFSHRNRPPLKVDWSGNPDAIEAMITWYVASVAFSEYLGCRTRR